MQRPIEIPITKLKFPVTAILSITHRISGFVLFLFMIPALWMLNIALDNEQGFAVIANLLDNIFVIIVASGVLAAFVFHFYAGCRHLLQDFGYFETLPGARASAWVVITLTILESVLGFIWLIS